MKILVVDDSIVFRMAITQALEGIDGLETESVSNGQLAIDRLRKKEDIDLITLDMEMPVMDGMVTIQQIRSFNKKTPIIVFSSVTLKGAEKTIEALSHGANDFVTKEMTSGASSLETSLEMIKENLLPKINAFKKVSNVAKGKVQTTSGVSRPTVEKRVGQFSMPIKPKLILIGSSTGGPNTLSKIFKSIKRDLNVPILVVQHMPALFTKKLADMLNGLTSNVTILEAEGGETLEAGYCYIAPGDFHLTLGKNGKLSLNQNEKNCFVRPSANVLFESVAENFEGQTLSFVLTGMGDDGANGSKFLHEKNGYVLVQDEDSSVVWGMPGAVHRAVGAEIIPLEEVSKIIDEVSSRL
jgi:two-component system, chemotaxis family, protein-glutamate methylesterase/glutaminase